MLLPLLLNNLLDTGGVTPPAPDVPPDTGAGNGQKHRPGRRRLFVAIDGQDFPVASEAEALELLRRARALAERQAEVRSGRVTKALRKKAAVPVVTIEPPAITVAPEIAQAAAPLIADIERLYAKAAETAELRLLLERQLDEDDDDVLLLL